MIRCTRFFAVMLCFLLSPLPSFCAPPDASQHAGQINALVPAAMRNNSTAKVKDDLNWNDLLKTQQNGRIRAGLADGSILSVGSNSELRVVQHDGASQQTSLEMDFGKVRSKVVKITQPNGKFEMKTPNAVIGVIGTDFFVGFEGNRTTVICYTGKVWVTPSANAKVVKNSGQSGQDGITVAAGQMVVIGNEVPPAGFESQSTPPDVQQASMVDTDVPDAPLPSLHPHLLRNVLIGAGIAATGWAVAITQLSSSGGGPTKPTCKINPQTGQCGGT